MTDLKMTTEGDLVIASNGDLDIVYGDDQMAQEALFRLKTTIGDWTLSPDVGASLEEYIGQPNIPVVHALIENRIIEALTKGNFLFLPNVKAMPIGDNEVFILVEFGSIDDDERMIQIQAGLDLRKGLVFSRIGSRLIQ